MTVFYASKVLQEAARWVPPAPLGAFLCNELRFLLNSLWTANHATSEEDVWNGYYIPKGCIVHFNIGYAYNLLLCQCLFEHPKQRHAE